MPIIYIRSICLMIRELIDLNFPSQLLNAILILSTSGRFINLILRLLLLHINNVTEEILFNITFLFV